MTNKEAAQVLQEEVNGIPEDLYDEQTERFKEAVRIATKALNTMPFIQDMSDTIDRLRAENQVVPVEIDYNNRKCEGYFDKKHMLLFPEYITAEMATKIGMTWQEVNKCQTDCVTVRAEAATEEDREKLKKLFQDPLPVEIDITEQDQRQLAASIVSTMPRIIETMADALPRIIEVAIEAIEKMAPEELIRIATSRTEEAE